MSTSARQLAVIGAAEIDGALDALAFDVGQAIARSGSILLCGGRTGVMEAAARGARSIGGQTIGILPGASTHESAPNRHIEVAIFTGMGQARNQVLVLSADAVIGIGGGWGTLTEIGLALKHRIPVILLASWQLERPDSRPEPLLQPATSAQQAVTMALTAGEQRAFDRRGDA